MNRRTFIGRTILTTASAIVFTASGWLMGTRTLTMYQGGPTPPPGGGCLNQAAGPSWVTCNGVTGCSARMCAYVCNGGWEQIWWGCNNQDPPCSTGYCTFEEGPCGPNPC
jgi:hypothetical protein